MEIVFRLNKALHLRLKLLDVEFMLSVIPSLDQTNCDYIRESLDSCNFYSFIE